MDFKHTQLDNGLTIIAEPNPRAHTAAVGFLVKVGTRDEDPAAMGVSHFLEHMMFKGTERRTADDVNRDFDRIGANYNASTSQETTCYFAQVLPEYIPDAIDILADILRPTLRGDDFDMEKNVILEEIGMYNDQPFFSSYERAMENYFGRHPLGMRILGTTETIGALKRDDMAAYFKHRYSPDNIVVSLAGNVDFDPCVDALGKACGAWKPTGATRVYDPVDPAGEAKIFAEKKLTNHYVVALMPGPSRQDEDRYAAEVLATVLGDAEGSRLYWKLIDPGLADEAEVSTHALDQAGMFLAYASCAPKHADRVEAALGEVLDAAGNDPTDGEVERARNKIATELTLGQERPAGRMLGLGSQWLYTGEYRSLDDELARVMAVTPNTLRDLCQRYTMQPRTIVRMTPAPGN